MLCGACVCGSGRFQVYVVCRRRWSDGHKSIMIAVCFTARVMGHSMAQPTNHYHTHTHTHNAHTNQARSTAGLLLLHTSQAASTLHQRHGCLGRLGQRRGSGLLVLHACSATALGLMLATVLGGAPL